MFPFKVDFLSGLLSPRAVLRLKLDFLFHSFVGRCVTLSQMLRR